MLKFTPVALLAALATLTVTAPVSAQSRSTVNSATLDAAVAARPAPDRAAVTAALTSSRAVAVAGRLGLSADELSIRVAALDDNSMQQISDRILAGGSSTVVISTTTIIIVLLVIILITN